jgi:hypothetical protein
MIRAVIAVSLLMAGSSARADQIDYFCLFANAAAAQADATVGAYWNAATSTWDLSQVFLSPKVVTAAAVVNGVSVLTGFWIMVSKAGRNAALEADTSCNVMWLDRDLGSVNGAFVIGGTGLVGTNRTNLTFSPVPMGSAYPRPLGK